MDLTILIVVGLILGNPRRNRYGKNKKKDKEKD